MSRGWPGVGGPATSARTFAERRRGAARAHDDIGLRHAVARPVRRAVCAATAARRAHRRVAGNACHTEPTLAVGVRRTRLTKARLATPAASDREQRREREKPQRAPWSALAQGHLGANGACAQVHLGANGACAQVHLGANGACAQVHLGGNGAHLGASGACAGRFRTTAKAAQRGRIHPPSVPQSASRSQFDSIDRWDAPDARRSTTRNHDEYGMRSKSCGGLVNFLCTFLLTRFF